MINKILNKKNNGWRNKNDYTDKSLINNKRNEELIKIIYQNVEL